MLSDADYRLLFERAPTPFLILLPEADFTVVDVNDAYLRATGSKRKHLLGQSIFDAFPDNPADPDASGVTNLRASLERVASTYMADTMAVQRYDIPRRDSEGAFDERYWTPINIPVMSPEGDLRFIIHRVEDVTEYVHLTQVQERVRSRADTLQANYDEISAELLHSSRKLQRVNAKLTKSEARFRAVADLVPELLWEAGPGGEWTWSNMRWMAHTGQSAAEACGSGWADAIHPEERERVVREYRSAVARGERFRSVHRLRAGDGTYRWFLVEAVPGNDHGQRIERWFGSATDIHEQRVAMDSLDELVRERTASLSESEERFRALIAASALAVWTTDATGKVNEDSASLRAFTGQTREQWFGDGWIDAVHLDDRPGAMAAWQRSVTDTSPFDAEFRFWHAPSRRWRWTAARAVPLWNDAGRIRGWVGMTMDIEEQKHAEAELRDTALRLTMAEQEERRRISQVLHDDMQQLLYGVQIKLHLVRQMAECERQAALYEAVDGIHALIGQAIDTTRQLTVDLSPPILKEEGLLAALGWLQRQMLELHGLTVTIAANDESPLQDEDLRVLLFQIVRELLFNVKKHAGVDHARIELVNATDHIVIRVEDTGRGADHTIFERSGSHSTGLGLPSVRERLRQVGGKMRIDSMPYEGTRIELSVPLVLHRAK
ncbi:PAS domain S-box protein [Halomonas sp. McH1-25]|uniref:PAS domain-containing sensor histidine kinase n=1 Tax=unclassified Halomonas TaxID=2609666 RepID=UPI001EF3E28A|nr:MULTISPECIES: PAS domain S-box protein [unclassified Halomonas]MCG7599323.1 PAS domain S-box protein [Halomonas sp. McH1-25]MCP1341191.1 PAS domain S-box protein [Halomonas sp. FL8]MCP1362097.1 PAS domain S-box protein [Halomonas sp. BBD45]